jgi:2'-5' RNA ligase
MSGGPQKRDHTTQNVGLPVTRGAGDDKQRIFVAVPASDTVISAVACVQEKFKSSLPGLRLMNPAQLHVTLAFIGDSDEMQVELVRQVVAGIPADLGGSAVVGSVLPLPSAGRARVVALALRDEEGTLVRLFEHVMRGLEERGVMQRERRPFRPHLTLGRFRVPTPLLPKYECRETQYPVESVCLYRSELKPTGAVHSVVERRRLERAI